MIVLDARPTQNEHRHRGIGRYVSGILEGLNGTQSLAYLVHGDRPTPTSLAGRRTVRSRRPHVLRYHAGWLADEILLPVAARSEKWALFHATDPDAVPDPRLVRTIATVFDLTPLHDHQLWNRLSVDQRIGYRRMLANVQRAPAVVTISEAVRRDVAESLDVPLDRIVVAYPGLDHAQWTQVPGAGTATRSGLLFVGAPGVNKNLPVLLRAAALMRQSPRITVAGPWAEPYARELASTAQREGISVAIEAFVSDERLRDLYRSAAAVVVPSRYEGFGLPVLEAMASGCPAVVSDIAALREVGGDGVVSFPSDDPEALAAVLDKLLADPDEQAKLAARGLRRARSFTWEASASVLTSLYHHLA